jgi:hypothetical protein
VICNDLVSFTELIFKVLVGALEIGLRISAKELTLTEGFATKNPDCSAIHIIRTIYSRKLLYSDHCTLDMFHYVQ